MGQLDLLPCSLWRTAIEDCSLMQPCFVCDDLWNHCCTADSPIFQYMIMRRIRNEKDGLSSQEISPSHACSVQFIWSMSCSMKRHRHNPVGPQNHTHACVNATAKHYVTLQWCDASGQEIAAWKRKRCEEALKVELLNICSHRTSQSSFIITKILAVKIHKTN